ncbi:MAG: hypothetical protein ACOYN1_08360 [Polynucleobacter sp.]
MINENNQFLLMFSEWASRDFAFPAPQEVKWSVLRRNWVSPGVFVETGTYLGQTTEFLYSNGFDVWTVELSKELANQAAFRFSKTQGIKVICGDSGEVMFQVLEAITKYHEPIKHINIFLDGHYSEGFTARGSTDTPIIAELECLARFAACNPAVFFTVFIDDCRCFGSNGYPRLDTLIVMLRSLGISEWHIEHDILVAKRL